jgi:hypothetical protein
LRRKFQPHSAIPLHHLLPPVLITDRAMIRDQQLLHFFFHVLRMQSELFKKAAGVQLARLEMKCFQKQPLAALGRQQPDLCRDHRSIAVSPKHRALDSQLIEHKQSFFRCPLMEVDRHRC